MMKRVTKQIYNKDIPESLAGFIVFWKTELVAIPEQYRDSARVEISAHSEYDGSAYCDIEVSYEREETQEEIKAGEEMLRRSKALTEARERRLLKQLKEKYE